MKFDITKKELPEKELKKQKETEKEKEKGKASSIVTPLDSSSHISLPTANRFAALTIEDEDSFDDVIVDVLDDVVDPCSSPDPSIVTFSVHRIKY